MDVENYIGQYVRIELESGTVHQGILEEIQDKEVTGYVRIRNSNELFLIPVEDIINIAPPQLH